MGSISVLEREIYGEAYLEVALEPQSLIAYQEQMINENHLPRFFPIYKKIEQAEAHLYYKTAGYQKISEVWRQPTLSKQQYLYILDASLDALAICDLYLLSGNSLLIHQDYIYINQEDIRFVYLPAELAKDKLALLRELVLWINPVVNIREQGAADAALEILHMTERDFSLTDLKSKVAQLQGAEPKDLQVPPAPAQQPGGPDAQTQRISYILPAENTAANKPIPQPEPPAPTGPGVYLRGKDFQINITGETFRLGRQPGSVDYVFQDMGVSRIHAQIKRSRGAYYLEDLKSTCGTSLNNRPLDPNIPIQINNGDLIRLCDIEMTFVIE